MRHTLLILKLVPRVVMLTVLITAIFPASGLTGPSLPVFASENPIASLDPVQGLIQFRAAEARETAWQTVTQRMLVGEGDWIRTDRVGLAYVTFFEGIEAEILPNTVVTIRQLAPEDARTGTFEVSLKVMVGDTRNRVARVLDAESRYEILTPSAAITVRGTDFWTSTTWEANTHIGAFDGIVGVQAYLPGGMPGDAAMLAAGSGVGVQATGDLGDVLPETRQPQYPPPMSLAPESCGNGFCEPGESVQNCSVDCLTLTNCGDAICQIELGEGPINCPGDCIPQVDNIEGAIAGPLPPAEPCTILVPNNNVALHVGPGFNRGIRDYLPANRSYPVIGQASANDGSLWWKIEIPNIPEAWVFQGDVIASGDCARVGESAAPPIVAPPPQQPTGPTPTPGTGLPQMSISFYADRYTINYYECVTISWAVEGIREVYYEGQGVVGWGSRQECPYSTTTYELKIITVDGQTLFRYVTITVVG
ncbi:MAG: FecR domain-containing protein [Anaerolineae bacterium]|nr:FecR domain-containing protein [Anaerolineae bacterium]